jgi:hypothetical protein
MNYFYLNINEHIFNINLGNYVENIFINNFNVIHNKF